MQPKKTPPPNPVSTLITPVETALFDPKYYWFFAITLGLQPLLLMSNENATRLRGADGAVMKRVAAFSALYFGLLVFVFYRAWHLMVTAIHSAAVAMYDLQRMNINQVETALRAVDFPVTIALWEPLAIYVVLNLALAVIFMLMALNRERELVEQHMTRETTMVRPALTVFVFGLLWHVVLFGGLLLFVYAVREYNITNQAQFHKWPL